LLRSHFFKLLVALFLLKDLEEMLSLIHTPGAPPLRLCARLFALDKWQILAFIGLACGDLEAVL
jgi:hypothetical protein